MKLHIMKYLYISGIIIVFIVGVTLQYSTADSALTQKESMAQAGILHNIPVVGMERDMTEISSDISSNIPPVFLFRQKNPELLSPDIQSTVALVQDIETGQVLYERNSFDRYQLASITKLLTAVTALQNYEWGQNQMLEMSASADSTYGRTAFPVGESFTIEDYIRALLLPSNNAAGTRLAEYFGGGDTKVFIEAMNAKAKEIGMDQSQFVNAHGLDEDGQYSTASDVMKLLVHTYQKHPYLWEIMQQTEVEVVSQSGLAVTLRNSNELVGQLPNMFGGKTGFTNQALENLASIVMIQDRPVGIVVMQAPIGGFRFRDTQALAEWIESQYTVNL